MTAASETLFRVIGAAYYLSGTLLLATPAPSGCGGCTIVAVKKRTPAFRRRKLSSVVVRKAITSYYSEQEQREIEKAAAEQNVSKSSFVASAALKEARRLIK